MQGLLDHVDLEDSINADDEIANEIKSLQHELVIISQKCEKTHRELLSNARKEMSKQKTTKKIDIIDAEVSMRKLVSCPYSAHSRLFRLQDKGHLQQARAV